ncbi:VWA domain-containing protein [Luteolibacter sp. SL250]|uniref:vWA domain-containing protein n=1 Tax=Luteolibacter sp. SL250 TaxID=2995170 RepID=UPI00226FFCCA|nr:VWA domain-containing protein [Luteolibacter sp. SL250]WAC18389.1 VWA domain-containing protein [Luteolibacter sp. SL250]
MRYVTTAFLTLAASFSTAICQEKQSTPSASALIVFDASGSMWGQINGKPKIEIAREVVRNLVTDLPSTTELGLMAYGHRRKGDCADIELLIPVGQIDKSTFIKTVDGIVPKGMTPITASLELAAEGLGYKENKATVILVSDGLETCDADPCAAAKKLEQLGVDFTAHVIAFDLKPEETEKLRCISDSTGGRFFPASDAASLKDALDLAVGAATTPMKPEAAPEDTRKISLTAPDTVVAGSEIKITWEAETAKGDYVTIAKDKAPDNVNQGFAYTHDKESSTLTSLMQAGKAEIRYISGITGKILARKPVELTKFEITLKAAAEAVAGSAVSIEWTGPNHKGDFITIVPKATKDGEYEKWTYTRGNSPLNVIATSTPGDSEIRYMNEQGNIVLARHPIQIVKGAVTLKAPAEAVAGSPVSIEWTGPNNKGDFITIVPTSVKDGHYQKWSYTSDGSPTTIAATHTPGPAEIRYMNEDGNKVLFRSPIMINAAVISLKASPQAVAGQAVAIEWTGPNNKGDFITIVPKATEDGGYEDYIYTSKSSPSSVTATETAGPAEIRYMNEDGNIVLARIPITLIEPEKKQE